MRQGCPALRGGWSSGVPGLYALSTSLQTPPHSPGLAPAPEASSHFMKSILCALPFLKRRDKETSVRENR